MPRSCCLRSASESLHGVPPPSQPWGLHTLRPWQLALPAASRQRRPGSSACKFQCLAGRRGEGGCPGRKKQSLCPRRAPRPGPLPPREPGAWLPQLGEQCGHTHPPCPSRRRLRRHSLREPPSPELPKRKKDGGVCRETTHSSVWLLGGDSGSSAQKEEEEEGTAQSNAICCTPQRCHWPPGASPGASGRGPPGATLRLAARGSCSPPPLPSSSSPSPGGRTHPNLSSARTRRRESRARWPQARLLRSPRLFSATLNLRGPLPA